VLKHYLEKRRQDEKGFTLIELMVVVLIMGILMAIAIPTFLSTRGSANDAAAKSNATNAFTNEKSYYASNQQFAPATTGEEGNALDDSLPWGSGAGQVEAVISSVGTGNTDNAVVIIAQSKDGNCFYIGDNEQPNAAYIGYAWTTKQSSGCSTPSAPTSAPTSGAQPSAQSGSGTLTWYQSW